MTTVHRLVAQIALTVFAVYLTLAATPAVAESPVLRHTEQVILKASAQKAQDAIKQFDGTHTWHPAVERTTLPVGANGKPLAVREFQLKGVSGDLLASPPEQRS